MTTVMTGIDNSGGAGVAAMAKLTAAERQFRHAKLVRYLDENDVSRLSVREIAEIVGISEVPVRRELRAREGPRPPGRKPGVPYSQAEQSRRRVRNPSGVTRRPQGEAERIVTDWLSAHPGDHRAAEIEAATGIPHTTLRTVLNRMGVVTKPGKGRNQWTSPEAVTEGEAQAPGQNLDYVSKIADGSLVAIDRATGLLWVLKPDRLL